MQPLAEAVDSVAANSPIGSFDLAGGWAALNDAAVAMDPIAARNGETIAYFVLASTAVSGLEAEAAAGVAKFPLEVPNNSGLRVLNRDFVPRSGRVLQNLATRTNGELAADLRLAQGVLSPLEVDAAINPGIARMQYGNALERLVAQAIKADPTLDSMFKHVGPLGKEDFVGIGLFAGDTFDITTPGQVAAHRARPYGKRLIIIVYKRPPTIP